MDNHAKSRWSQAVLHGASAASALLPTINDGQFAGQLAGHIRGFCSSCPLLTIAHLDNTPDANHDVTRGFGSKLEYPYNPQPICHSRNHPFIGTNHFEPWPSEISTDVQFALSSDNKPNKLQTYYNQPINDCIGKHIQQDK